MKQPRTSDIRKRLNNVRAATEQLHEAKYRKEEADQYLAETVIDLRWNDCLTVRHTRVARRIEMLERDEARDWHAMTDAERFDADTE
jgi:hypothetical protein|tara:strand:- start:353 stop:613 length:261 start_codon:yes stop_codon:yes gene_type:complete